MPSFFLKSKKQRREQEMDKLAKDIVAGARKKLQYNSDTNPIIQDFRKRMNDVKKK